MASSGEQDTHGSEAAHVEEAARAVAAAAQAGGRVDEPTVQQPVIPAPLVDVAAESTAPQGSIPASVSAASPPTNEPGSTAASVVGQVPAASPLNAATGPEQHGPTGPDVDAAAVDDAESPTTIGAPASKERIAEAAAHMRERGEDAAASAREKGVDAAAAARERSAEAAAAARERSAEAAAVIKEKGAEAASLAKEKGAEVAATARERGARARGRIASAAADARDRASSAAADARERASNADVTEFAHNTTSLIDTARPFFLAGCAAVFAVLGFFEGDSGTAEVFAVGALLCVLGAAFSAEINGFIASRSRGDRPADEHNEPPAG